MQPAAASAEGTPGGVERHGDKGVIAILPITTLQAAAFPVTGDALCGVYFLFQDDRLVYIGKAVQYFSRLSTHLRKKNCFNRVAFVQVVPGDLATMEAAYIRNYLPEFNVVIPLAVPARLPPAKFLMTRQEAARLLIVSLSQLSSLYRARAFKRYHDGRRSYFDLRELSVYIANRSEP